MPDTHLVALVGPLPDSFVWIATIRSGEGPEVLLPVPDVLLLEDSHGKGTAVFAYTATGDFSGDSWFETREEAMRLEARRFGEALGPWQPVPTDTPDPIAFAIALAAHGGSQR